MGGTRIINVTRKPAKCPRCGEAVWDIVYRTGEMSEVDIMFAYRKSVICGGDNIPRRPPIWGCSCGCSRFRKVNEDGTDASVKVKMLKDLRRAPLSKITWQSKGVQESLRMPNEPKAKYYDVEFMTEMNEKSSISVCAISEEDAKRTAQNVYSPEALGFKGQLIIITKITEKE